MQALAKIALSMPGSNTSGKQFTLKLKKGVHNEPSEYKHPSKLLAVSDIEGNFMAFLQLLVKNKVIDKYLKWTFGDGHLVIAGDCFDRGEQVAECLWLIYSLEEKARKKGGYVHFILGNHEIMNLNGDWRYMHPKYAETSRLPYTALYNGNIELWRWLCTKNIMEKIGDTLFVHGGVSEELLQWNLSVTEINEFSRPFYNKINQAFDDPFLQIIFSSTTSPFWYRGYYHNGINEDIIDTILAHFGIKTIVTGHTVVTKISSYYKGKVINIDTDHAAGISEALYIRHGKFYRVDKKGKIEKIK